MNNAATEFLEKIADSLAGVGGVDGVVLGGSRARGTNAPYPGTTSRLTPVHRFPAGMTFKEGCEVVGLETCL